MALRLHAEREFVGLHARREFGIFGILCRGAARSARARKSSQRRCCSGVIAFGGFRSTIGSPVERNGVPWYAAGMKPLPQFGAPPIGPPR